MSVKYKEFTGLNLPAFEQEMLNEWAQKQAFEKSVSLREGATPFVFYEGPPSANGLPGIHHVISRTLKDLVCRYKTMKGFQVKRKGGWDTHGLPIELGVEKELGITKEDIGKKISVEDYNKKCREAVLRYKDKWDDITRKMGYWVDLNDPYITYKNEYIETVWWLLSELYKKGLLYESVSIQPYSPAAGTGLSSHELNQPGTYKDVKDTSAVAMFKAIRNEKSEFLFEAIQNSKFKIQNPEVFFLAWTTTPWTLPSNLGLTVGPNIDYVLVKTFNPYLHIPVNVILAKALLGKYFKEEGKDGDFDGYNEKVKVIPWKILAEFKGKQIEECHYEQLLPFEANSLKVIEEITPGAKPFRVLVGDFVTTEDGTGIVHTAPAFGADDFRVGKKYGIGILIMVDKQGKFVEGLGEFSNRYVKNYKDDPKYVDVNVDIAVKLKKENRAFKVEKYEHNYPHCWRTDKPILYYPLDAWFIKTTAVKERMVELNKTINWKPKSTGEGRFGNWLENMVDWNLSRSRFWGTPLPVWRLSIDKMKLDIEDNIDTPPVLKIIGSIDELIGGYFFDINKFRENLLNGDSNLKSQIEAYNSQIHMVHAEIEHGLISNIANKINYEDLMIYAKREELNVSELIHKYEFTYSLIKDYCVEIDSKRLEKADLHRHWIDKIIFLYEDGEAIYYRVPDLIDVWFDSGAMPYAQWHFPFENKEVFAQSYPADFIAEGVDQTRGWFYTLHAISCMIQESLEEVMKDVPAWTSKIPPSGGGGAGVAYKTCVSNGLVLDKNGNKMSKRLGNVVDPFKTIETFGADATRWYLVTNASPWDNMKFDLDGIKEVQRKFFGTLYNTYQFFALYANVDGFSFKEEYIPLAQRPEIDRWILSSLNTVVKKVNEYMDDYEPTQAGRVIEDFVDEHLSNWYVRLCRRRFWKGEYEQDKICAYQTLYECLESVTRLIAPISPFFSDVVFQNLNAITKRFKAESVHHVDFPVANESVIDESLEERMQLAQDASSLVLSLRKKANLKVRQPLQKVLMPVLSASMKEQLQKVEDLIKAEVNVKEIEYLNPDNTFISKKIKPNFVALGKKLGPKMKAVASALAQFTLEDIAMLEKEGQYNLSIDGEPVILQIAEVEISSEDIPGWTVANKGSLTVALDVTVTPELEAEGNAREFVNRIQKIRKDSGFELTDRVEVKVSVTDGLKDSLTKYKTYICAEILADKLEILPELQGGTEIEVNDIPLTVIVLKKG
ncbi:MAG TPA: class I tRNA ligase family protein [Chitinophagaceae bacterium]|nr:class I tRNA ligase family protein [Chitinophagaceae bacterium]